MTAPEDWSLSPADLAEVEADLARRGMPDSWLRHWRALLDRMAPGDEVWWYSGREEHPAPARPAADPIAGFEQVRDGEALRRIGLDDSAGRSTEYRSGYALIRDGEVLDWIEEECWRYDDDPWPW